MFPPDLTFHLDADLAQCTAEVIHGIFPNLQWGVEPDLLKHSDDWPEAVALIKNRIGFEPGEDCQFPVEVNFVHFPGRVPENEEEILPLKLGLLSKLAAIFECRVLCCAREYCHDEENRPAYSFVESFLCRSGRIYSGRISCHDAARGAKPGSEWIPLDDLPSVKIDETGKSISKPSAVLKWIETRDQTHLVEPEPKFEIPDLEPKSESSDEDEDDDFPFGSPFPGDEESEEADRELEEHFKRLDAWEKGYETTASKQLIDSGISLPPPDSFPDEAALHEKLWEVIHGLRSRNTYLYSTDHLSDLELYTYLWKDGLNEGIMDLTGLSNCGMHLDILGSGDDESTHISLTYYDSAEYRAEWLAKFPDEKIPAHIDKPYDRDRLLPQREY